MRGDRGVQTVLSEIFQAYFRHNMKLDLIYQIIHRRKIEKENELSVKDF